MLKLLLICSIITFGHSSCPDGFDLVKDGQCRGEYMTMQATSYEDMYDATAAKCNEINALPIIIHDDEEQNYWSNMRLKDGSQPAYAFPIGLMCNVTTKLWQWSDGSALDYKPAAHDAELNSACKTDCIWTIRSNGWWYIYCGSRVVEEWVPAIFCTKQLHQPLQTGCGAFDRDEDDGVCYEIGEIAETWTDAQMNCKKVGADLASIHNSQENSFVRRLAISKGAVSGVFLGATVSGKGNEFGWIDGSEWDYQNFYPGFPMTGFGQCLLMDTSTTTGQWMNRDCSIKEPVACIRNETDAYKAPTCNSGPWLEGGLITSPGYPFNASVPCEYFISVDKGKLVEAEIISLEANSCCDYLTIYDDYVGGNVIANISGYVHNATFISTTNYMKVVWQPNGGANVKGMAMVFHGV